MQTWGDWRTQRAELIIEFWVRLSRVKFPEMYASLDEGLLPGTVRVIRSIDFGKDNNPTDSLHCQIEKQLSEIRREHAKDGLSIGITEYLI